MPPSSLYWIQKSASSISAAAANRRRAASPEVRPPLASAVAGANPLTNSPAPMVPAPTASDLPKKERRLIELFDGLSVSSKFSSCPRRNDRRGKMRAVEFADNDAVGLLNNFIP